MTSFVATPVPESWGCDTIFVFDAGHSEKLKNTPAEDGKPYAFILRYGEDLSLGERDLHLGLGWILCLVFHVARPSWQATPEEGTTHGNAMVSHANRLEAPAGMHVALDLEGLGDVGAPVMAYIRNVATVVHAAALKLLVYIGYCDGITLAQLAELVAEDSIDLLWSDFGSRTAPDGVGFVCKQSPQGMVAGVCVDRDYCYGQDLRGVQLFGMALAAEIAAPDTDPGLPHVDPIGDHSA